MRSHTYNLAILALFSALAFAAPAMASSSIAANGCDSKAAAKVVSETNEYRVSLGLSRLSVAPKLLEFAVTHARDMAASNVMTHSSSDGLSFAQRARASSYRFRTMRENIALESTSISQGIGSNLMNLWKHSAAHDANMRATDISQIGVAVARGTSGCFASMELGKPLS
jgi:uncharacterized protein YkwD